MATGNHPPNSTLHSPSSKGAGSSETEEKLVGRNTKLLLNLFPRGVPDKTKYMAMSRDRNARSHSIKIDTGSFERVEQFKYLGTPLTKQTLFRKKLRAD